MIDVFQRSLVLLCRVSVFRVPCCYTPRPQAGLFFALPLRPHSTPSCAAGEKRCYDTENPGPSNRAGVVCSRASWPPCAAPRARLPQAAGPAPANAAAGRAGPSVGPSGGAVLWSCGAEPEQKPLVPQFLRMTSVEV